MALFRPLSTGRKNNQHEAESPFWISFADQMTALMVLFLIALTVALYAVTERVSEAEKVKTARQQEITAAGGQASIAPFDVCQRGDADVTIEQDPARRVAHDEHGRQLSLLE